MELLGHCSKRSPQGCRNPPRGFLDFILSPDSGQCLNLIERVVKCIFMPHSPNPSGCNPTALSSGNTATDNPTMVNASKGMMGPVQARNRTSLYRVSRRRCISRRYLTTPAHTQLLKMYMSPFNSLFVFVKKMQSQWQHQRKGFLCRTHFPLFFLAKLTRIKLRGEETDNAVAS